MSSAREEILKNSFETLQNKVNALVLEINIKLSRPENVDNVSETITKLMLELSLTENAMQMAKSFYLQSVIPETHTDTQPEIK